MPVGREVQQDDQFLTTRLQSAVAVHTPPSLYNPAMPIAKGTFDVKVAPIEAYNSDPVAKLGRMSLDKQYHGDLTGSSKGEMLSAMGEVQGSAAAVAVERVTGKLSGR